MLRAQPLNAQIRFLPTTIDLDMSGANHRSRAT
jgi:hypothetical protein